MFPRPETPGSWQVMWRTEKGRRYRTFPSLAEANYYASELQRERRTNGARVAHGLMSSLKLDARRIFPMEIKGYPAATKKLVERFQSDPKNAFLESEMTNEVRIK